MGIAGQQNMSFSAWDLRLAMVFIPPTSFDPFPPTGSYWRAPRLQESEAWGWQESKNPWVWWFSRNVRMIFPWFSHWKHHIYTSFIAFLAGHRNLSLWHLHSAVFFAKLRFCHTAIESATADKEIVVMSQMQKLFGNELLLGILGKCLWWLVTIHMGI